MWFLPSTSEQNISDDAARTVGSSKSRAQPTNISWTSIPYLLSPRRYHEWIPNVGRWINQPVLLNPTSAQTFLLSNIYYLLPKRIRLVQN